MRPPKTNTQESHDTETKPGHVFFLCGFYVNCDMFFSSFFSASHSRWLCESEAAQWFGWKNWEFGGWEWWEPCYLAQGLRGVKTKSIWNFCRDAGGLRNRCQTKISGLFVKWWNLTVFLKRKGDPNQFEREESTKYMSVQHLLIDCIFWHLTRFEDSKVEGFWVIGEPPGTKVRSYMIFQTYIFRLSDPKGLCESIATPPKINIESWNNGTWKLVVWKMRFLFQGEECRFHINFLGCKSYRISYCIISTCDYMPGHC